MSIITCSLGVRVCEVNIDVERLNSYECVIAECQEDGEVQFWLFNEAIDRKIRFMVNKYEARILGNAFLAAADCL